MLLFRVNSLEIDRFLIWRQYRKCSAFIDDDLTYPICPDMVSKNSRGNPTADAT